MKRQALDEFARQLETERQASVRASTKSTHEKRTRLLEEQWVEPDALRRRAGEIKQHVLANLDRYLLAAEARLQEQGVNVHWAETAEEACALVDDIMRQRGARSLVKAKTMVSEEIGLTPYLEARGRVAVETDLGEFIVQIDGDHPSHIVRPIIHKNRREIAESFAREGLGDYNDDPATITRRARQHLRGKFLEADVGVTGANFISAESGRLVVVTNEGNSRFCLAAPKCHIALVGIEKLVPTDADLGLFLNLLARSATGQDLTVYTEFVRGPAEAGRRDGPEAMHVILVDNGRTEVLAGECREILRCIRCGACMNVCPVYRQTSGHGYRSVYPGPVGAVLSPLLKGKDFQELADLPKASSLCGACQEVCPVNIPIPEFLLRLRAKAHVEHAPRAKAGTPEFGAWAWAATHPMLWRQGLRWSGLANNVSDKWIRLDAVQAWTESRQRPQLDGGAFRAWFKKRKRGGE